MSQSGHASPIERTVENLSGVLRALRPGGAVRPLHCGPIDVFTAIVVLLVIEALTYAIAFSAGSLSFWEMRSFAGALVFHVLAVVVVVILLRRSGDLSQLVIGLLWAMIIGSVLALVVSLFAVADSVLGWILIYGVPSLVPPVLFLITALGPIGGVAAGTALVGSVAIIVLEWSGATVWGDAADDEPARVLADTEAVYAAQPALMALQTERLRPGDPDRIELFAVLGAGYPYERVFRREVEAVSGVLAEEFGAQDRVVSMVNSLIEPVAYPLLNRGNLLRALRAVRAAMNDDDILLLYLTSHGAEEVLSTEFAGVMTRNLTLKDVDAALDASGIGNAVVIVSACYSGSFADALAGPTRLILTAASADSASFGCSDQAEWTHWGRAFFVEGLAETRDPREAALIARTLVAEWEDEQGYPPSDPLILEGAAIGPVLDAWLATFAGQR